MVDNTDEFFILANFDALDPVHTGPDPYGHHINLKSLKTSMTLKFVIILQNLIKAYHRKSGKSKYDRKLTELDVETTRIRSRVNGVLEYQPSESIARIGHLFYYGELYYL